MQAAVPITRLVLQREGDPQSRAAYTHAYRHSLDREIDPTPYWQQIRRAGLDRLGGFQSSPARISTINKVHLAILGCWMLLLDRATNHNDMPFIIEENH